MIVLMNVRSFQDETRPNSRIDTIASNNGYGLGLVSIEKNASIMLTFFSELCLA